MNKQEIALDLFTNTPCNCAQAVLLTFSEDYGVSKESAASISACFGGGIARQGEICGALSGALMVLGLKSNKNYLEDNNAKAQTYTEAQNFIEKFKSENGGITCKNLLCADIKTEEGRKYIKENNLHEKICNNIVVKTVELLIKQN